MIAIEGCHMLYTKIGGATPSRSGKLKKNSQVPTFLGVTTILCRIVEMGYMALSCAISQSKFK